MNISKINCIKHIYLIAFILIQVVGLNSVQGLKCVQCTDCKDDLSDQPQDCPTTADVTYNKCFTRFDNDNKVTRGCLTSTQQIDCASDTGCVSTDENKNNQIVCKSCPGSSAACSQTDVKDSKYNKICDPGMSRCFKKVIDKLVVRGCATEETVAQCTDKNTCEICNTVNCNVDIFPPKRLSCYQCSGDNCNDVANNNTVSQPCQLFEDKDECYMKAESDTKMIRGCKSDTKDNQCSNATEGCAFCNENGCNNLKYKRQSSLKCYQCSGNSENCFQNQTESNLKPCVEEVLYNQTEYCYTQIDSEKIQRGCLNDNKDLSADKCNDVEGGACSKCTENACNGKNNEFTCIRCRSDENTDCWNDAPKITGEKCRKGNSSPAEGCYHGIWNGVAIRGCMIDASPRDQATCRSDNNANKCKICHAKNCNIEESAAAKNDLSLAMMSIVLIQVALWSFK